MSRYFIRSLPWLGCLFAATCLAGEIIIVDTPPTKKSRSGQEAERTKEAARQAAGRAKTDGTLVIVDDTAKKTNADAAADSMREARDYVRPPVAGDPAADGNVIILRAAPQTDAEKAKNRARSYTVPAGTTGQDCRKNLTVMQVGTIGDNPSGGGVVEKGNSTVITQCK